MRTLGPVRSLIGVCLPILALAGCVSTPTVEVRPVPSPSVWPSAYRTNGICAVSVPDPSATTTDHLPTRAESADLYWYEGFYSHTCRTYHSRLDASGATTLLGDLRAMPTPKGVFHCPSSVNMFVQIWFRLSTGYVSFRIGLDGCVFYLPKNPNDLGPWPPFLPAPRG